MKVVLVTIHPAPSPQAVPLAAGFLAAYLATDEELAARVSVVLCDGYATQDPQELVAAIRAAEPDAVGFSIYLWGRALTVQTALLLRAALPGVVLFAGGPEVTADPPGLLGEFPFDCLILGEGEVPFVGLVGCLVKGASPRDIAGTAWLEDGRPVTLPAKPVRLLDTIPSPLLSGILDRSGASGLLWQLSRGCDFACDYCFDAGGGRGVRRFSLERIDAEIDAIVARNVPQVFVLDSSFNVDMKRAKTILRMIRKRAPHVHFHFEVRSEFLDREMARLFAGITCSLQIGLQSADPAVLKRVHRLFDPADFRGRVAQLNESGAVFGFDLMYGLPGDSYDGFVASLDFALSLYPNHLDLFPLAVLPGTALHRKAAALGLVAGAAPPYTLYSSPNFDATAMAEAAALASACDIFYSRGRAVAWFNGVVAALRMNPAALLKLFADWLRERHGTVPHESAFADDAIWTMQRDFLTGLFQRRKLGRYLPVALDLVDYHYHYGAALLAIPPELPTDRELARMNLLEQWPVLAPSTRLVRFAHEIYDLLEAGEVDLREFAVCFTPRGSWAVLYPRGGEVFTESLLDSHAKLLAALDGMVRGGGAADRAGVGPEEAASFLEFAAAEGIVVVHRVP